MTAKTPAERQAALKDRRKVAGLLKSTVWAHPDDMPSIREHAAKLARKRERAAKKTSPAEEAVRRITPSASAGCGAGISPLQAGAWGAPHRLRVR